MKKIFILNILLLVIVDLFSQTLITKEDFNKLLNQGEVLYINKANHKYYGCGLNVDCWPLQVDFSSIYYFKTKRVLKIDGFVNSMTRVSGDTLGTNIFRIFIAKPVKGKLTKIRVLLDVENNIKEKSKSNGTDLSNFKFSLDFKFSKNDKLYIESTSIFSLNEYNIGSLVL